MTAQGFGRKGMTGAAVAPRRASLVTDQQPRSFQPASVAETMLAALKAEQAPAPTDRSLKTAYALWFFAGLGGGHRFYLRRPWSGAIQALLFFACVGAVVLFQFYQAFAGLAVSWLWYLADGIRLKRLHLWSGQE